MTALIVAAQIDISIGAVLAVSAVVAGQLAQRGWPVPAVLLGAILAGAVLGSVNGGLTAGLKIPSIVATLATLGALRGLLTLVTHGETVSVPESLTGFGSWSFFGLPTMVWTAALVTGGTALYLSRTRRGRQYYAVGSNPQSAALSGLPVTGVIFRSFVLLGALGGLAGSLYAAWYSPISQPIAPGFELEVITAVVVGGTDIFGGEGTVQGTALAAVLLSTIRVALTFLKSFLAQQFHFDLPSETQQAVQGLLILAAVLYNSLSRRRE
jgi:ribose/xylose/arabinose/galactoside ABC-type transport system permease subunit